MLTAGNDILFPSGPYAAFIGPPEYCGMKVCGVTQWQRAGLITRMAVVRFHPSQSFSPHRASTTIPFVERQQQQQISLSPPPALPTVGHC